MFDHHATTDFASRITHPHIQTTSNQSFRHHTNEKYAQKQHKMANLEVESDRLKKHQTPPHQQKTRNQQHKMAYKPQALEEALTEWKGTLVIASHDQWLINHWQGRRIHTR
ncbi:hypothetical protein QEV55_00285 [Trueperella pyogenes]|uniref:hypothetical protein n=1 Tax=Trueperella pyogenes TaxID=1661 RepID=UPI00312B76F9